MKNTTRVFISYSWDSHSHKEWVREFGTRLRKDGVEAILDRWHTYPGDQLPQFMESEIRESDFVLIICTPKYKDRSDNRTGGVGYEGDIITGELFLKNKNRKYIPILRTGSWDNSAPSFLSGKYHLDLSDSPYSEDNYRELLSTLLGLRETAPPLGTPAIARHKIEHKPVSFEDQHQALLERIKKKKEILAIQSSPEAINSVANEVLRFKNYFNERCAFLGKNIFDRYILYRFSEAVHAAHIGYGQYMLECNIHIAGYWPNPISTTQEVLVALELSQIFRKSPPKELLEEEHRLFYYTPESSGWALPHFQDSPTNKEIEVLFNTPFYDEYYDLNNPMTSEHLVDIWLQKLIFYSSKEIEKHI